MQNDQSNLDTVVSDFRDKILKQALERNLVFLIMGRTGVGKTSTVNSLLNLNLPTNPTRAETMTVESYDTKIGGIKFSLVDTPGLCDSSKESHNDQKYLNLIKKKVEKIDCLWFVTQLNEPRVRSDEKHGIKLITEALTPDVWERAIIIFTHANDVDDYTQTLETREKLIKEAINHHLNKNSIVNKIPVVAIDNNSKTNPDGREWLSELYTSVFTTISQEGMLPFLIATQTSLEEEPESDNIQDGQKIEKDEPNIPKIKLDEQQQERIKETIRNNPDTEAVSNAIMNLAVTGAIIGSVLGPVGTVVGGVAGAIIGWLLK